MASSLFMAASAVLLLSAAIPSARAALPTGCGARLLSLAPCAPFAQGLAPAPPDACCDGLADVYRHRPQCLCVLFNRSASLPVNRTLALRLPPLCGLALVPDARSCPGLSLPPFGSPAGSAAAAAVPVPSVSPAFASPPPPPPSTRTTSTVLFGMTSRGNGRMEGAPIVLVATAFVWAGAFYLY